MAEWYKVSMSVVDKLLEKGEEPEPVVILHCPDTQDVVMMLHVDKEKWSLIISKAVKQFHATGVALITTGFSRKFKNENQYTGKLSDDPRSDECVLISVLERGKEHEQNFIRAIATETRDRNVGTSKVVSFGPWQELPNGQTRFFEGLWK